MAPADRYLGHVEDHAVEVEEDVIADVDVAAVVAVEGRLQPQVSPAAAKQLLQ